MAGRWSDKNGREQVLTYGCWILLFAVLTIAFAQNIVILTISAVLFGISMGIISPISQAWTVDLCEEENRGKAIATMYIALEAGIGFGALLPTFIYQNKIENLTATFLFSMAVVSVALIYIILYKRKSKVVRYF
jgi:MFS family permease